MNLIPLLIFSSSTSPGKKQRRLRCRHAHLWLALCFCIAITNFSSIKHFNEVLFESLDVADIWHCLVLYHTLREKWLEAKIVKF